jgi:ABC-type tungstate transport system substrate-binding protein
MPTDISALQLVLTGDPTLVAIVRLSLAVSLSTVLLAGLFGLRSGALIAITQFPGRQGLIVVLNALRVFRECRHRSPAGLSTTGTNSPYALAYRDLNW